MNIDKLFETLEDDVKVLRDAIECGLYGTRSIVADQVLKIEHQIKSIKRHLSNKSSRPNDTGTKQKWTILEKFLAHAKRLDW